MKFWRLLFVFMGVILFVALATGCRIDAVLTTPEPATAVPVPPPTAAVKDDVVTATAVAIIPSDLVAPTLFDTTWDDRTIYQQNLIESEYAVLEQLSGAPIYHIDLQIESPSVINGQQEIRYTNQTDETLDRLYFHLFPNQIGGTINISNVLLNGTAVAAIDEGGVLQIPLEQPLAPGAQTVVQMDFTTTVPTAEESTKYNVLAFDQNILALAHFYPLVARVDEMGWHIEPSPPNGDETFADAGFYRVRVTAPAEQVIVATGSQIDQQINNSTQTIIIVAGPARDFYLAMSDDFQVVSDNIGALQINSYGPTGLQNGAQYALEVAADAVQSYSSRFSSYPYRELDIVSIPTQALGIEYPGVFANALRIYDLNNNSSSGLPNSILLESTTAHETAHQWYYNLVGNDQLNEPWLDEALTQYATWLYYIDRYGAGSPQADGFYKSLEGRWARVEYNEIPIGMAAGDYSGLEYGAIIYGRGPIFIGELATEMGQDTFATFLHDYNETYRWQISTSRDFQALAESHCQCDLTTVFNAWIYE